MGDMADFIGWNSPDYYEDECDTMGRIDYLFKGTEELIDVYLALRPTIKGNTEIADNIVEFYKKYNKLSERQRTVLLGFLSNYEEDCVLYKKFLMFYNYKNKQ